MKNFTLSSKLYALTLIQLLLAVAIGAIGLVAVRKTNEGLTTVYNDRVVPLKQLKAIADDYAVSIIDAANKANAGLVSAEDTRKNVAAALDDIQNHWKDYMSTSLTSEEAALAKEAETLFKPADDAAQKLKDWLTGKSGTLKDKLNDFDGPLYATVDPISAKITELVDLQLRVAETEYKDAQTRYAMLLRFVTGVLLAGGLLGGSLGWWITRSIAQPIHTVADALSAGATQTAAAAGQVSASSHSLADGASKQAASLEETSSSLEEMSSMTKRNAENTHKANDLAREARHAAENGVANMQAMNTAMEAIKISGDDIAKIIKTIDEIAFQTNILALNAAVEAARAGEAGMGFAVVADEVRNLAQRSAHAAKETASKIEGAISKTAQGVVISSKVAQALSDIVAKVRQVNELVAEVASASREQTEGINQINTAVGQMDNVTQSNAASAQESAAAAEELNAQAANMKMSVGELLLLVGGKSEGCVTNRILPRARAKTTSPGIFVAKQQQPALMLSARNGSGQTNQVSAIATAVAAEMTSQRGMLSTISDANTNRHPD